MVLKQKKFVRTVEKGSGKSAQHLGILNFYIFFQVGSTSSRAGSIKGTRVMGTLMSMSSTQPEVGWTKSRQASGVLCDKRVPIKPKGRFYRTVVRSAISFMGRNVGWPRARNVRCRKPKCGCWAT